MPTLVRFGKVVCRAHDPVVENVKRLVLGKAAGVEVNAVRHISGQEQHSHEIGAGAFAHSGAPI